MIAGQTNLLATNTTLLTEGVVNTFSEPAIVLDGALQVAHETGASKGSS
jgi:hypothetical protein